MELGPSKHSKPHWAKKRRNSPSLASPISSLDCVICGSAFNSINHSSLTCSHRCTVKLAASTPADDFKEIPYERTNSNRSGFRVKTLHVGRYGKRIKHRGRLFDTVRQSNKVERRATQIRQREFSTELALEAAGFVREPYLPPAHQIASPEPNSDYPNKMYAEPIGPKPYFDYRMRTK